MTENFRFSLLSNDNSAPIRDQISSLPFFTPFNTYPGNATKGWRGGALSMYRKFQLNECFHGPSQTLGAGELMYDPLNDTAAGLRLLRDAKKKQKQYSEARNTYLPSGKRAIHQYATYKYAPMAVVRSLPHYYHTGVPPFALDRIPKNAANTATILGDQHLPTDRQISWTVRFDDIPVNSRAFVGLVQDSPALETRHLTSSNPLLFWTDLWESRLEGCGIDIWRMYDGRLKLILQHLPTREDSEYLGRTVPVNNEVIGEIYPPDSFSPVCTKIYDVEDRLAAVKDGMDALSAFRASKGLTQYTNHTRSVPSLIDRPKVEDSSQSYAPLEVIVTSKEATLEDTGTRNIRGLEIHFAVGKMAGTITPLRTWDPIKGMKRYFPCVGIGKDVMVRVDENPENATQEWNEARRAFVGCKFTSTSGLVHA
eukprot:GEMP01034870.1.p1 GENE.GEMP01034870.1~~GEMP01034870.1.p1  ORF type:complete len:424 (+),score=57.24 GEMP01034870.1:166-1437(+)